jgi:hypothetical protein
MWSFHIVISITLLRLRLSDNPADIIKETFTHVGIGATILSPANEHSDWMIVAATAGFLSKTASH